MSACYFLSSVCLVSKANLGEGDKPQLHLRVQQPGLTENLLEFATHHGNSGLGTVSCQVSIVMFVADIAELHVNELPERSRTETEVTTPGGLHCSAHQRCQSGWSKQLISAHPTSPHYCHSCSTGVGGKLRPAQAAFIVSHQQGSGETGVILEELGTSCYMHDNVLIRSQGNKLLHFVGLQVTKTSSYG